MLFALYVFIDVLRHVFTFLVILSCIGCTSILIEDILLQWFKPKDDSFLKKEIYVPCCGKVGIASIIGTIIGLALSIAWLVTKNWMLNNVLGLILSITFLKTVKLGSLIPGLLLLSLLFFYDIFWVFISPVFTGGQSVMVVVASGLDIPIKLVMPHLTNAYPTS